MKKQIFVIFVVLLMLVATVIPCFAATNTLTDKELVNSFGLSVKSYGNGVSASLNTASIDTNGRLVISVGGNSGNLFVGTDLGDFNNVVESWTIEAKLTGISVADNWHYGIAYNNDKFNTATPSFTLRAGAYTEGKDFGQIICTAKTKTEKPYKLGQSGTPVATMSAINGIEHVFSLSFDATTKTFIHKLDNVEVARIEDTKNETSLSEFSIMIPNRSTVAISYMRATTKEGDVIYNQDFTGNSGEEDTGVKHTVTVNYVYADGTTAAPTVTRQVSEGNLYAVKSPVVKGSLPDKESVYARMGTEDVTITVTYSNPLKLTIHYVKADGTKMFDDYVKENLAVGESYYVTSILDAGYTVDKKVVEGVMGNSDVEITVVYTPVVGKYKLIIKYVYEDNTQAAKNYTQQYSAGEAYSVESPEIEGYTPDQAIVEGDSINSNMTVTVVYKANSDAAGDAGDSDADGKSGCGSVLSVVAVTPIMAGVAWLSTRRKKD